MKKTGRSTKLSLATFLSSSLIFSACGNDVERHYDILADSKDFVQSAVFVPRKVDILWVIDNSLSMKSSQDNLAASFTSFIERFKNLKYDFHMAVTTTEAYNDYFSGDSFYSPLRDGNPTDGPTGYPVLDNTLPDDVLVEYFIQNMKQGTGGDGDERAFHSIQVTLENPVNATFRRSDAFLAVIIVSDEEELSHDSSVYYNPKYHTLHTPQKYVDFLTSFTAGQPKEDFSVSAITIVTDACYEQIKGMGQSISYRNPELVELTGGVNASLCDNFGPSLELISDSIIELAAVFKLDREPVVSSIRVTINGAVVPNSETNGWIYLAAENSIKFNGTAVPQQGQAVSIDFDPVKLKN